jgi:eukaryotic-like serine/threonine-protein kinase
MRFKPDMGGPYKNMDRNPVERHVIKEGETIEAKNGDKFELLQSLGEGGMGKVFKAKDQRTGIERAIKFMHFNNRVEKDDVARFKREMELLTKIKDQFILDIIDVIEVQVGGETMIGMVTDFVDGPSVSAEMKEQGKIEPEKAIVIIAEVALALQTLKEEGVVHKDIKPANIFLEKMPNGESVVRVGDFGISGLEDDPANEINHDKFSDDVRKQITEPTTLRGTAAFMAPESLSHKPTTHKSDIYSTGLVLYEMLSGEFAIPGEHAIAVVNNQINTYPEPLKSVGVDVPDWLEDILNKMIRKNPDERFDSAMDVYLALKEGVKKDYPELLNESPFLYDFKKTKGEEVQEEVPQAA